MGSIGRRHFRMACFAVGWLLVVAVSVLSLIPAEVDLSEGRDKWSHQLAYGTLMLWFSMLHRAAGMRIRIALAFLAMGVVIEFLQGLTGYRSLDVFDMLANTLGIVLGWLMALTPLGRVLNWLEGRLAPDP